MKTDVFIKVFSDTHSKKEMERDIAFGFQMMRDFESRCSRFKEESELSRFNTGSGGRVSPELFFLLKECARFYALTNGVFDPSVLPVLEKIGYKGSPLRSVSQREVSFTELIFDEKNQTVQKPKELFIDLGGIGKGYIVDRVADELSKKYNNGIVDAGGDMRVFGGDKTQDLDSFAIDVESSFDTTQILTTLLLSNGAVATSGINRRNWEHEGHVYHHIIDPSRKTSAETDIVQVTVIAPRSLEADVFAKTLLILGLEKGLVFATKHALPALFVGSNKQVTRNSLFQHYEWKA